MINTKTVEVWRFFKARNWLLKLVLESDNIIDDHAYDFKIKLSCDNIIFDHKTSYGVRYPG